MRFKSLLWFVFVAGAVVLVLWLVRSSRTAGSRVTITFLNYTNSPGGTRYALFGITNLSHFEIERLTPAVELAKDPNARAPGYDPMLPWIPKEPLKPESATLVAVRVPPEQGEWRLLLRYQYRTLPEKLRDFCLSHGRPVPLTLGPITLLGPPQYSGTNTAWLAN